VLTTQFYFPDEPQNRTDDFFHRELVMQVATVTMCCGRGLMSCWR